MPVFLVPFVFVALFLLFFGLPILRFVIRTVLRMELGDWAILLVTAAIALPALPVVFVFVGWRIEKIHA